MNNIKIFNSIIDTFQNIVIAILLICVIGFPLSMLSHSCRSGYYTYVPEYKRALAFLNGSIYNSVAQNKINPATCKGCNDNKKAIAEFFSSKLNVLYTENFSFDNREKIKEKKKFSFDFFKKSGKQQSPDNPSFVIYAGYRYEVIKAKGICGTIKTNDPDKANCVILVDTNELKAPNKESTGNSTENYVFNDQYKVIVKDKSVEPAFNATNDVAKYALNN